MAEAMLSLAAACPLLAAMNTALVPLVVRRLEATQEDNQEVACIPSVLFQRNDQA